MKTYFLNLIKTKNEKLDELRSKIDIAATADEVRSLSSEAETIRKEIREAQSQLDALEAKEKAAAQEEARAAFNPSQAMNVVSTATQTQTRSNEEAEDARGTMEYRTAFMNYVQRGETSPLLQFEKRTSSGRSTDLGVLIPSTIIQKIMQDVEKVYGQLYSRVRKTNIAGGVKYPIGSFSASFNRITEAAGVSSRQHAGEITGTVEFSYNIGEIRLARTLLQTVLSVPVFEQEFAKVVARTYIEAMDKEIMVGNPTNNQMCGILTNHASGIQRIAADHIIEFTAADMADWTKWQEKLFAVIPLSMRSLKPEFVMTANTYEANIKTLKDNNNRPVYNETFNPVDGSEVCTFKGKQVVLVEDDILENFNDATDGEYFGMYWVPEEAYAINSNLEFSVVDYFDHETNQYVKKALVINDGKLLDPKYIYLLKKKIVG